MVIIENINTKQAKVLVLGSLQVCGYVHASLCARVCVCVLRERERAQSNLLDNRDHALFSPLDTVLTAVYGTPS